MNRLFNVIYAILMILWLFMLCYLIIIEDWESLIKNISIFFVSFIGGSIYSMVTRGDK